MSTLEITGYQKDQQGIYILHDPLAQLIYVFDWSDWLPQGDTVASVNYTLQVRANDPTPLVRVSQGTNAGGTQTFVEISGGGAGKIYTVTAAIVTTDGSIDRRNFRVKVENRSA
jgi:hypothetical protein